jgi:hypothetical protein
MGMLFRLLLEACLRDDKGRSTDDAVLGLRYA